MPWYVEMCSRDVFNTFCAFSYVSSQTSVSYSSMEERQHLTALASRIFESSGSSRSTASFQRYTEAYIRSSVLRNTFFLAFFSSSRSVAFT